MPREVNASAYDVILPWHAMLEVFLDHALHCANVSVTEWEKKGRLALGVWPVQPELEIPFRTQRERNYLDMGVGR